MRKPLALLPVFIALLAGACADEITAPRMSPAGIATSMSLSRQADAYVILGLGEVLPASLTEKVEAAGGVLLHSYPEIGVAYASSSSPGFRRRLERTVGIESVTPDIMVRWTDSVRVGRQSIDVTALLTEQVASIGDADNFFSFQWAPAAVGAPEAWNAGYRGRGVRVAILDGGIYRSHIDLLPNVDVAASRSFVPGVPYDQEVGTFWHGTHVAGIVAAAANGIGTVGIAPEATIIGVKISHDGSGNFGALLAGLMYAATPIAEGGAGAHIINMSMGSTFDEKARAMKAGVRELHKVIDRATKYAYQRGVTVIAAAGNSALNLDDRRELYTAPAQNLHVISVGATGPHGWALGAVDFARPAYYTDYGKSLVDVSAPGGTIGLLVVDDVDQVCTVTGTFRTITTFCETFDMIFSTVRGPGVSIVSYNWAQGTSMAAPMAAGVAALIIERHGGTAPPALVGEILRQSALDLGKPGNDEVYGHGWVNAARAVR